MYVFCGLYQENNTSPFLNLVDIVKSAPEMQYIIHVLLKGRILIQADYLLIYITCENQNNFIVGVYCKYHIVWVKTSVMWSIKGFLLEIYFLFVNIFIFYWDDCHIIASLYNITYFTYTSHWFWFTHEYKCDTMGYKHDTIGYTQK